MSAENAIPAAPSTPTAEASPAAPAPATTATPKAPESAKAPTLDEAMEGIDFANLTDEQHAAFESGDFSKLGGVAPVANTEPENEDAENMRAESPTGARQAAITAQTPEELAAAGDKLGGRVSIKVLKPEDRARTVRALDLVRGGKTPADAFAEVFGITGQPATAQPAGEKPAQDASQPPAKPAAPSVASMEAELATLQAKYKEAKEAYDPAATDLLEQLTDLKMDLREARRDHSNKEAAWQASVMASQTRVLDMYSEYFTDESTGFAGFCDDEVLLAEAKNDPIMFQPDWPEKIGQRVMSKYFKGNAAKSAAPVNDEPQTQIPPAPRNSVRLPGSPVGSSFTAGSLSPVVALAEIDKLTPAQQDEVLKSLDVMTSQQRR